MQCNNSNFTTRMMSMDNDWEEQTERTFKEMITVDGRRGELLGAYRPLMRDPASSILMKSNEKCETYQGTIWKKKSGFSRVNV